MPTPALYHYLLIAWFALSLVVFVVLLFVAAPYGRHTRRGWGPTIPGKLGWVAMEAPASLAFALFFLLGALVARPPGLVALVFFALWQVHYVDRAFLFPLRQRGPGRPIPLLIALFAVVFNLGNAYMNGHWLGALSPIYPAGWLIDPRFLIGLGLFAAGFVLNRRADAVLARLRAGGQTGYRVPMSRMHALVSCPNYLGEIIEWGGWALATWSLAGLAFFVWTAANLVPRAIAHHRWYLNEFPDYPRERKALIPFLL